MTEEDREFVYQTAKATAHEVAQEVTKMLPCKEHMDTIKANQDLIIKHEAQINNGLTEVVQKLNVELEEHIKDHQLDRKEREKGRRSFWRAFIIGAGTPIISGLVMYFIFRFLQNLPQ